MSRVAFLVVAASTGVSDHRVRVHGSLTGITDTFLAGKLSPMTMVAGKMDLAPKEGDAAKIFNLLLAEATV